MDRVRIGVLDAHEHGALFGRERDCLGRVDQLDHRPRQRLEESAVAELAPFLEQPHAEKIPVERERLGEPGSHDDEGELRHEGPLSALGAEHTGGGRRVVRGEEAQSAAERWTRGDPIRNAGP